ncbi:hypothetical protein BH09ACT10_BH09ACT10_27550 [soil metagenome]
MKTKISVRTTLGVGGSTLALLMASACGGGSGGSDTVSLQYSSGIAAKSSIGQGIAGWAEAVDAGSKGSVKVKVFHSGSLLSIQDTLDGVKDGRVDIGYITDGYTAADLPLWTVADIPFITDNPEAQINAFQSLYEGNEAFRKEFEKQGLHVLHFIPVGPSSTGAKKSIETLEDFDGLKIRGVGRVAEAEKLVGAEEVFLPLDQVYETLQRNIVDAWSGILFDLTIDLGFNELRDHITDTGVGLYASSAAVMNLDAWNALSDEQQGALEDQTEDYYTNSMKLLVAAEAAACEKAKAAGTVITALPEGEVAKWKDIAQAKVIDGWKDDVVKAGTAEKDVDAFLVDYRAAIEKQAASSDYVNGMKKCIQGS